MFDFGLKCRVTRSSSLGSEYRIRIILFRTVDAVSYVIKLKNTTLNSIYNIQQLCFVLYKILPEILW